MPPISESHFWFIISGAVLVFVGYGFWQWAYWRRQHSLLAAIPETVVKIRRDGKIVHSSRQGCLDMHLLRCVIQPQGIYSSHLDQVWETGKKHSFECPVEYGGHCCQYIEVQLLPCERDHVLITLRNITERKQRETQLQQLCHHDQLTGLYNRTYFEHVTQRWAREDYPIGFIICDVDGLKAVNDQQGHLAGDVLIRETAELLRRCVRREDSVIRLGGDEFLIVLPRAAEAVVEGVCERIQSGLRFYNSGRPQFEIGLSLGCAAMHKPEDDIRSVLDAADKRMYQAKPACGRNCRG